MDERSEVMKEPGFVRDMRTIAEYGIGHTTQALTTGGQHLKDASRAFGERTADFRTDAASVARYALAAVVVLPTGTMRSVAEAFKQTPDTIQSATKAIGPYVDALGHSARSLLGIQKKR